MCQQNEFAKETIDLFSLELVIILRITKISINISDINAILQVNVHTSLNVLSANSELQMEIFQNYPFHIEYRRKLDF